jgi:hypothetical protein
LIKVKGLNEEKTKVLLKNKKLHYEKIKDLPINEIFIMKR